jgi:single-strand DNA-binding protein
MSLNKAMLIGRLGKDPETRYTSAGKTLASFSLATDEGKDQDGKKRTEWHKIVAWEKLAEICQQHLKKGSLVFIEGRLATRKWKDAKDQERTSTEIVADRMRMLDGKPDAAKAATATAAGAPEISDDDIPF